MEGNIPEGNSEIPAGSRVRLLQGFGRDQGLLLGILIGGLGFFHFGGWIFSFWILGVGIFLGRLAVATGPDAISTSKYK